MNILHQIQSDLLNQDIDLPNVLRKARVLAHQLQSEELRNWLSQELDGYSSYDDLPDYRILRTALIGTFTNGYRSYMNYGVPLFKIKDQDMVDTLTTLPVFDGVRKVEEISNNKELHSFLPQQLVVYVNHHVSRDSYGFLSIEHAISSHDFKQILDTIKNRLLDFILLLSDGWSVAEAPPPKTDLESLISITIYNEQKGGDMTSTFDQRGQNVNYQYNAAGNINIGSISDTNGLVREIGNIREEIERAKDSSAISQDTAVESSYHLLQAEKEAQKEKPDKKSFLEHIGKAKALLEDVTAAAGLVGALLKVSQIASTIFQ